MPKLKFKLTVNVPGGGVHLRVLKIYQAENGCLAVVAKLSYGDLGEAMEAVIHTEHELDIDNPSPQGKCYLIGMAQHYDNKPRCQPDFDVIPISSQNDIPDRMKYVCLYENPYTEEKEYIARLEESAWDTLYCYMYDHQEKYSRDVFKQARALYFNGRRDETTVTAIWQDPMARSNPATALFLDALISARDEKIQMFHKGIYSEEHLAIMFAGLGIGREDPAALKASSSSYWRTMGLFAVTAALGATVYCSRQFKP